MIFMASDCRWWNDSTQYHGNHSYRIDNLQLVNIVRSAGCRDRKIDFLIINNVHIHTCGSQNIHSYKILHLRVLVFIIR
jgi:hypothetical protein